MYTTRTETTDGYNNDSKYTVADILSCMANGEPLTPYSGAGPSFVSSAPTGTTPILTPTTLANLEQSFIELQSVPVTTAAQDLSRQSGFVPPVINPIGSLSAAPEMVQDFGADSYSDSDDDYEPPSSKRAKGNQGSYSNSRRPTGPRRSRNEKLTPEEEDRRKIRRERNKVAAAKCRQRRVDLTNKLINESENLEEEKATLENEIQTLQQQKEQLEFLLQAHKPMCSAKHKIRDLDVVVKTEPGLSVSAIVVKPDPDRIVDISNAMSYSRPNTLPIASNMVNTTTNVTMATGVPITTPSSGVGFSFVGLESMVDGHTGLTPITGPSCASQVQRNSSDSSPTSDALASPSTLMAL